MKELKLEYQNDTASSIEDHLVPALKHPNCNLAKLSLPAGGIEEIVLPVEAIARGDVQIGGSGVVVIGQDPAKGCFGALLWVRNSQPRRWDAKRPEAQRLWVGGGSSLPRRTSRTPPSSYSPSIGIDTRGSELDLLGTLGFGACISAGVDKRLTSSGSERPEPSLEPDERVVYAHSKSELHNRVVATGDCTVRSDWWVSHQSTSSRQQQLPTRGQLVRGKALLGRVPLSEEEAESFSLALSDDERYVAGLAKFIGSLVSIATLEVLSAKKDLKEAQEVSKSCKTRASIYADKQAMLFRLKNEIDRTDVRLSEQLFLLDFLATLTKALQETIKKVEET
ncbi:hypothetical protein BASA62_003429 [Batrachochytrium salamandrivorans]|nr:hypothetical protein BASA62_003429 [Batrachochytrium salamandrivorans]